MILLSTETSNKLCLCKFVPGKNSQRIKFYRFILKLLRLKFKNNYIYNRITRCVFPYILFNNCILCYSHNSNQYNDKIVNKIVISLDYIRIRYTKK